MTRDPGQTFLRWALHYVPLDARPEVVLAFALATANGATNAIDAFLSLCREYIATYVRAHTDKPQVVTLIEAMTQGAASSDEAGATEGGR